MAIPLRVGLTIQAYDRVTGVVKGIGRAFNELEARADKANKAWANAGNLRNAAEGVGRFGRSLRSELMGSEDSFRNFQYVMLQLKANADDLSEEGFAGLEQRAKTLGQTTRFSAQEAADGMLQLSKAGFGTKAIMEAIGPTLNLASAESLDLGRAAEISAGVMTTFKMKAEQLGYVGDVLSKTASMTTTDVSDLGESFKYAGGQAQALGITLPQTAALFAALAQNQIKGSMAGTSAAAVMRGITGGGRAANKVLKALGVNVKTDKGKLEQLPVIFSRLSKSLAKFGDVDKERILTKLFGAEGVPGAIAIMGAASREGEGSLENFTRTFETVAGETQRKADIMGGSAEMVEKRFAGAMGNLRLEVGKMTTEALEPFKMVLTEIFVEVGQWVKEHPKLTKVLVTTTLAVSGLATVISGALFAATSIYAVKGFAAFATAAKTGAVAATGVGTASTGAATGVGILNGALKTTLITLGAVALAWEALSLAEDEWNANKTQLTKWDDVKEGFKGMWDTFKGSDSELPWMMNPDAGLSGVVSGLFNPMTAPAHSFDETETKWVPNGFNQTPGGNKYQGMDGTLKIEVSDDRVKVTPKFSNKNMNFSVNGGL